jgi:hypothetical protein
MIEKLASAIYNDIVSGLVGITSNPTISRDQLEDDVVDEYLQIIKEYSFKNIVPKKDLVMSINCVDVDCLALDKCPSCTVSNPSEQPQQHFQIPQIVNDLAEQSITFIGSTDKQTEYIIYTDLSFKYHKYKRRMADKPYVYIETTPNDNNMYDGWIFNAPFVKKMSITFIPKDPRQLDFYGCCAGDDIQNYTFLSAEIKKRLTEKKIRYYRQLYAGATPNTQTPK